MSLPKDYYRCTIIRGKSQKDMDDLLPAYAEIVNGLCPSKDELFNDQFNEELSQLLYGTTLQDEHKKTIRNHVTEIAGKLLGLYWRDDSEVIHCSQCTEKLIKDNDQPAFFKNLCLNFQFPNGTQKINTILERIRDGIRFKPFHFIITLLHLAEQQGVTLKKTEICFYVLSSKEVLCGRVSPETVLKKIIQVRSINGETEKLDEGSNINQHVNEQINLLVLANLISDNSGDLYLNHSENAVIKIFQAEYDKSLNFSFDKYTLDDADSIKKMYADWGKYYGSVRYPVDQLRTKIKTGNSGNGNGTGGSNGTKTGNATEKDGNGTKGSDTSEVGVQGENIVFEMERKRVRQTHPNLEKRVMLLSNQKGLGYDISSVEAAEKPEEPEYARYIEVKTTIRTTVPSLGDEEWIDTINITHNEWVIARQFKDTYNIYRVYITKQGVFIRKINNPSLKFQEHIITLTAISFRLDFKTNAIDQEYTI